MQMLSLSLILALSTGTDDADNLPFDMEELSLLIQTNSQNSVGPPLVDQGDQLRTDRHSEGRLDLKKRLAEIYFRLSKLQGEVVSFWLNHGPDEDFGGFHGTLDESGNPKDPTDKGVIAEARHLWTFSKLYSIGYRSDRIENISNDLYRFLIDSFLDATDYEFYWMVSRDGTVQNSEKRLYSNSFAIFALSQYAIAFRSLEAATHALNCFYAIDARTHDDIYGGYDQSNEPNWLPSGAAKGTNTQLHILEALTTLYYATGDPLVRIRLNEMVQMFLDYIIQSDNYCHPHFELDWTPVEDAPVSYGHDIETSWLLYEAARAVGRANDPDVIEQVKSIGELSIDQGYDNVLGGLFYEGVPQTGEISNFEKIWWVQGEALCGIWRLYDLTHRKDYINKLEGTLRWIENYQSNEPVGEWYWGVDELGQPLEEYGSDMANEWKASYHSVRSLLTTRKWLLMELYGFGDN